MIKLKKVLVYLMLVLTTFSLINSVYGISQRKSLKKVSKIISEKIDNYIEKIVEKQMNGKLVKEKEYHSKKHGHTIKYLKETDTYLYKYKIAGGKEITTEFDLPNKIDIVVECKYEVVNDTSEKCFLYKYTVNSLKTSKQNLSSFTIWISTYNVDEVKYPTYWCYFNYGYAPRVTFGYLGEGDSQPNIVKPGEQAIFEIKSKLPPIIVKCDAQGFQKQLRFENGYAKDGLAINSNDNCVAGYTMGPGIVDKTKGMFQLLKEITDKAYEAGWIEKKEYDNLISFLNENSTKNNLADIFENRIKDMKDKVIPEFIWVIETISGKNK